MFMNQYIKEGVFEQKHTYNETVCWSIAKNIITLLTEKPNPYVMSTRGNDSILSQC